MYSGVERAAKASFSHSLRRRKKMEGWRGICSSWRQKKTLPLGLPALWFRPVWGGLDSWGPGRRKGGATLDSANGTRASSDEIPQECLLSVHCRLCFLPSIVLSRWHIEWTLTGPALENILYHYSRPHTGLIAFPFSFPPQISLFPPTPRKKVQEAQPVVRQTGLIQQFQIPQLWGKIMAPKPIWTFKTHLKILYIFILNMKFISYQLRIIVNNAQAKFCTHFFSTKAAIILSKIQYKGINKNSNILILQSEITVIL